MASYRLLKLVSMPRQREAVNAAANWISSRGRHRSSHQQKTTRWNLRVYFINHYVVVTEKPMALLAFEKKSGYIHISCSCFHYIREHIYNRPFPFTRTLPLILTSSPILHITASYLQKWNIYDVSSLTYSWPLPMQGFLKKTPVPQNIEKYY